MAMKVVVIEDKPLIRRAIVETLDWSAMDCELVADAADGLVGKAIVEQHRPDIIITDIRMPDMDGLQLAEYAKGLLGSCKVIVITGYQDFNYAKECVRLGVQDYILKPLNNEEIMTAVTKAVNQLKKERHMQTEKEELLVPATRQLLSDVLNGEDVRAHSDSLLHSFKLAGKRYGLLMIHDSASVPFDLEQLQASIIELPPGKLEEEMKLTQLGEHTALYRYQLLGELVYVYVFQSNIAEQTIVKELNDRVRWLKESLTAEGKIRYRIASQYPISSLEQLRSYYVELSRKLRLYFFNMSRNDGTEQIKLSILHELEQFHMYLASEAIETMEARIQPYLASISTYAAGNITVAKALVSELCMTIAKFYYKKSNNEWTLGQSVDEILSQVNRISGMSEAETYIRSLLAAFNDKNTEDSSQYSSIVRGVIRYIDEHYRQDIGLNVVADQFHISSGHLSRLLRKETGYSFVDIVTRTRIQAAKRLMRDPSKRIQEISELTGFKNYIYFYQVFKKHEQISPQEYKNKL